MLEVSIRTSPYQTVWRCSTSYNIDLHESVKNLKQRDVVTNDVAIKVFKQIKWESDVKWLLERPRLIIDITCSVGLLLAIYTAALAIPPVYGVFGLALWLAKSACINFALGKVLGSVNCIFDRDSYDFFYGGALEQYSKGSARAGEIINALERGGFEQPITFENYLYNVEAS